MPLLTADSVSVLPDQRELLEELVRIHSTAQQLALPASSCMRSRVLGVRESARELGVWPKTVRYWRRRWRQAYILRTKDIQHAVRVRGRPWTVLPFCRFGQWVLENTPAPSARHRPQPFPELGFALTKGILRQPEKGGGLFLQLSRSD